MPTSTRFAVAVQVLSALALGGGKPVTSELLARSAKTNPAVIRRLVGQLTEAGLTASQLGQGGGTLLAKPATRITLLDVYRAVEDTELFALPRSEPNKACVVGCFIRQVLCVRMTRAQRALEKELRKSTIAEIAADIARLERSGHGAGKCDS